MANTVRTARDPAGLAKTVIGATWAYLGANLLLAAASAIELAELIKLPAQTVVAYDEDSGASIVGLLLKGAAAIVLLVSMVVSGFLILKWIYRVNLNASVWAPGKTISPA